MYLHQLYLFSSALLFVVFYIYISYRGHYCCNWSFDVEVFLAVIDVIVVVGDVVMVNSYEMYIYNVVTVLYSWFDLFDWIDFYFQYTQTAHPADDHDLLLTN